MFPALRYYKIVLPPSINNQLMTLNIIEKAVYNITLNVYCRKVGLPYRGRVRLYHTFLFLLKMEIKNK